MTVAEQEAQKMAANALGFAKADTIRREHNGIFGVRIFLGHDGHNVCELSDYDKVLGKGDGGVDLLQAVERAMSDVRRTRFLETTPVSLHVAIEVAILEFGVPQTFNTASLQARFRSDDGWMPTPEDVSSLLNANHRIVRLSGGCHWYLLPGGHKRDV